MAGVAGDIGEFGTMTGRTAVSIATAVDYLNKFYSDFHEKRDWRGGKRLHLFDSFEGLPEPVAPEDLNMQYVASKIWTRGACKGLTDLQLSELGSGPISGIPLAAGV